MKKLLLPPLLLFVSLLFSQVNSDNALISSKETIIEKGIPYFQNFSPNQYDGHSQNWAACQNSNGIMYFANTSGVLEYDGTTWRKITISNNSPALGLEIDSLGTIYVGAINEIGYLGTDSNGLLEYRSLREKLEDSTLQFGQVRKVHIVKNEIYFVSDGYLFFLDDLKNLKTIKLSEGKTTLSFQLGEKLYVLSKPTGLEEIRKAERLKIISPETLGDKSIYGLIPHPKGLLIATDEKGLFLWDNNKFVPFAEEYFDLFSEAKIYCAKVLSNGEIAIGTRRMGVFVIDLNGKIITILNDEIGLLDGNVTNFFQDRENGLWMTLGNGIVRVEYPAVFSTYNKKNGLKGVVNDCKYFEDKLYVLTSVGGFYLDLKKETGGKMPFFEPISGIDMQSWKLLPTKRGLLSSTAKGIYLIENNRAKKISEVGGRRLVTSVKDSNRIWVAREDGLFSIYHKNGGWITEDNLKDYNDFTYIFEALENGDLWIGSYFNGVYRIQFPKDDNNKIIRDSPIIEHFDTLSGLPDMKSNRVFKVYDKIVFTTKKGLYSFDDSTNKFVPNYLLGAKYADSTRWFSWVHQDNKNNIWMHSGHTGTDEFVKGRINKEGTFEYITTPFNRFASLTIVYGIYFGPKEQAYFYGPDGILQYDGLLNKNYNLEIPAIVRKVTLNDSVLRWGSTKTKNSSLPHGKNSMVFEYSLASFDEVTKNHYQYQLVGFDTSWSDWTAETKKEYTNLSEGIYTFRVKGKNIYDLVSKEGEYQFEVLPPWYRTWWAYLIYLLLFGGFLWGILKLRSRQLKAQNEALEKLIAVRTSEVRQQANQLKIQAEKLQELDRAKSRFFANISHEFRTPLTLIKGPIEQLEQNFTEKLNMETVKMIRRNANRLLNMVNQLLDLSKIDEGSLKLAPTEGDVYKCLRAAAASFNSHAAQRNMDYRVEIPPGVLWASFDRDKLENIIYNLLGNAFKFSGDGSKITFFAEYTAYGLQIKVSDTGKGISKEKLPFIFDRFFQVDDSNTRDKGGSGIGLSLSKDLVELMDGTITVSSEIDKGTFFTIQLPIQEIKTRQKEVIENIPSPKNPISKEPFVLSGTDKRNLPTVLLVEDNRDMRYFITEQLIKFYKVNEAINGEEGLQKALAESPDLVITDLMMPKMDGIELCKSLKIDVLTSHIPVIMLTAKAGMDNKIEGLESGADDYLTKPFDGKELLVRTKNLIEQRRRLRELYSNKTIQVHPKKITVTSIDQKFLEKVLELLETNFAEPDFGVPQMQEALAMSKTQLHRKLKALTNEAPGELLRNFRLKRAAQLLAKKADSVTQVAYKVGFNNLSYFAKCFKELYGVAPSSYQKQAD
jgi:signal transduction histidine kinase/DNA-binding response OmpR family regulator/ligand-binding sensor domain-containing protein